MAKSINKNAVLVMTDYPKIQYPPLAILGAGSWGTALGLHLSRLGQIVHLWTFEKDHADIMQKERVNNRYLPQQPFPETLHPTADLSLALKSVTDVLIAVPSIGFRATLVQLKSVLPSSISIVLATKGLDETSGQLLHHVALEIIGVETPLAVLSGPSFAREVAAGLPTAVVIASENQKFAAYLLKRFTSDRFRVYLSADVKGVEIGGIVKNVLAIATGISDGMGFGANARCALITRGLAEMMRLGVALGGHIETLHGLAGLGDLILTCTDDQSRNRRFGLYLGQGKNPEAAEQAIGQVVEGKRNALSLIRLAEKNKIEMPIIEAVHQVLQGKITPTTAMQNLLSRTPRSE